MYDLAQKTEEPSRLQLSNYYAKGHFSVSFDEALFCSLTPNTQYFFNNYLARRDTSLHSYQAYLLLTFEDIVLGLSEFNASTTLGDIQSILDEGRMSAIVDAAKSRFDEVCPGSHSSDCLDTNAIMKELAKDPLSGFETVEYDSTHGTIIYRSYSCSRGEIKLDSGEPIFIVVRSLKEMSEF